MRRQIMNAQFKKGVLELCVLALLKGKDCYGYELVNSISEDIEISEGTIYPLLRRLSQDNLLLTYLQESEEGPPRKYYKITELGVEKQHELEKEWKEFAEKVEKILGRDL